MTTTTDLRGKLYDEGIVALERALPPEWADRLGRDYRPLMEAALNRPRGTIARGPNRFYHAVHPEQLDGFVELIAQPLIGRLLADVLGEDWQLVEVGFDTALPGAVDQPWHRDFPTPDETSARGVLHSLALNTCTIDGTDDCAPFEIAPGTQWDDDRTFAEGRCVPPGELGRYEQLARRRLPRRGDVSCRTPLAVHRGTANRTQTVRPVMVVGVVAG